jgi:hypothetical protein
LWRLPLHGRLLNLGRRYALALLKGLDITLL